MYLHEFQSKTLFINHNLIVPRSFLLNNINQINDVLNYFNSDKLVLKAQIHSGARFKNGGIVFVSKNYDDLYNNISNILGKIIVTDQTDLKGKFVNEILIEEFLNFDNEFYMSLYLDRDEEALFFLFSFSGGVNIERNTPHNFVKFKIELFVGLVDYQIKEILNFLNLDKLYYHKLKNFLFSVLDLFLKYELILLEINPLVIFNENLIPIDLKIEVDDNSFFRNSIIFELFDARQGDYLEIEAKKYKLSYVSLDGNIGCLVNGAGLAMATIDLIKINGGNPANFLDVGGDVDFNKIFQAFNILLKNSNVNCIFINIFGGIVKCDMIANSLIEVYKKLNIKLPVVVRMIGNMSKEAINIIKNSKCDIFTENKFLDAVKLIVNLSKGNL